MYQLAQILLTQLNVVITPSPASRPFPEADYHPLYGMPGKVDKPGTSIKTNFRTEIKQMENLNGRLDNHIASKPVYKEAYAQRKLASHYNQDTRTQISPYHYPAFLQNKLHFADGSKMAGNSLAIRSQDTFYETVKMQNGSLVKSNRT
jgi:hypothetical protein